MSIKRMDGTGRISRGVIVGDMLYLSGLTPLDLTLEGIEAQTQAVLERCDDLLIKYGSSRENLVSATIYLKNMDDYNGMNAVWDSWVKSGFEPTRACVKAEMASPLLLVEIVFTATLKNK